MTCAPTSRLRGSACTTARRPGSPELLSLSLSAMGRPEHMAPVAPGEVESEGARVEIRRPGLVEWYANSPEGLEQGFTVAERPAGKGRWCSSWRWRARGRRARGDGVIFQARTGRRLAYGKLAAWMRRAARWWRGSRCRRLAAPAGGGGRGRRLPGGDRSAAHGDGRRPVRVGPGERARWASAWRGPGT